MEYNKFLRKLISIHALREEGDRSPPSPASCKTYFYPRPPRGGRPSIHRTGSVRGIFLSTPSARRATYYEQRGEAVVEFLSTPSARRATRVSGWPVSRASNFYPRPPRGGRRCGYFLAGEAVHISIHALREEGDGAVYGGLATTRGFLSTPSARRATHLFRGQQPAEDISIHALREEGDAV